MTGAESRLHDLIEAARSGDVSRMRELRGDWRAISDFAAKNPDHPTLRQELDGPVVELVLHWLQTPPSEPVSEPYAVSEIVRELQRQARVNAEILVDTWTRWSDPEWALEDHLRTYGHAWASAAYEWFRGDPLRSLLPRVGEEGAARSLLNRFAIVVRRMLLQRGASEGVCALVALDGDREPAFFTPPPQRAAIPIAVFEAPYAMMRFSPEEAVRIVRALAWTLPAKRELVPPIEVEDVEEGYLLTLPAERDDESAVEELGVVRQRIPAL